MLCSQRVKIGISDSKTITSRFSPATGGMNTDYTYEEQLGVRYDHLCQRYHKRVWNSSEPTVPPDQTQMHKMGILIWNHARNEALISSLKPSFPHIYCYWFHFLRKSIKIHRLPTTWVLSSVTERHWKILKCPCNLDPKVTTNLHLHVTGLQKLPYLLFLFFLSIFLAALCNMHTLSSPTRDQTRAPSSGSLVSSPLNGLWVCVCSVAQLWTTLRNTLDCCLPGSSVHGIFQTRKLELKAISYPRQTGRGCHTKVTSVRRKSWCQPIKWQRTGYFCLVAMLPVIRRRSLSLLPFREPDSP